MKSIVALLSILQIAVGSSCPDGFDLVANGECRGYYTTMNLYWDERAVNTAIQKCEEIDAVPPIIHKDEQQAYWQARGWLLISIVCHGDLKKWIWTDWSPVDYRPPHGNYHSALDHDCVGGGTWDIKADGYWNFVQNSQDKYDTKIYCKKDLPPLPVPSADGCQSFEDDSDDRTCYQIGTTTENWQDARQICKSFGADLASIHNSQENSFVRRLAVSKGAVNGLYLGGVLTTEGVKVWIDGSNWDYENFVNGFPINGLGRCIAMDTQGTSGQWVNVDCAAQQAVACQRRQNYIAPGCSSGPWKEGDIITSPGFPFDASIPCEYILNVDVGKKVQLEVLLLEANSCCDRLVLTDNYIGGTQIASLTGEINNQLYNSTTSNFMRVSWQPNGAVNVRGVMMTFRAV